MPVQAAILGVGESPIGEVPNRSAIDLQAEAVAAALRDAGRLESRHELGLITLESAQSPVFLASAYLAEHLGLRPRFLRSVDLGGTTGCIAMLQDAINAIEDGIVDYVAVTFGTDGRSRRVSGMRGMGLEKTQPGEELVELVGAGPPVVSYALLSARLITQGIATEDALCEIARVHSENAMRSTQHQRPRPITAEAYRKQDYISWPLRRYDCSLVSDGAGAVLLGPASKARHVPVFARGIEMLSSHASVAYAPHLDVILDQFKDIAGRTLRRSGVELSDVDCLYTHDAFTTSVAAVLAALGKPTGKDMARWIAAGALGPEGELPTNTHGGLLSQAHIGGILHLVEAVRQLRGEAGQRQVAGAKNALIVGNGGVMATKASVLLTREAA